MNWYEHTEKTNFGYKMLYFLLAFFPPKFMRILAFPIGFFYFIFGKETRRFSKKYLSKLNRTSSLRHIISFALNIAENVQCWGGKITFSDITFHDDDFGDFKKNIDGKKGVLFIISHLGNAQMLRGIGMNRTKITTVADFSVSSGLHKLLTKINPDASLQVVNANDFGPETILFLQEKIEQGEIVVIAGDRISANTDKHIRLPFLGEGANFPYGVFLLAALLNAPTYFVNGLRKKDLSTNPEYDFFIKKNRVDFNCPRSEREGKIIESAKNYARNLAELCEMHPYQWYNFFDFWENERY